MPRFSVSLTDHAIHARMVDAPLREEPDIEVIVIGL
jgi:hypothetical protein